MSSQRGNVKKGAPKYQNSFAYKHNPKSKKTEHILGLPIHGLCPHCHAQIVWRKKYRKYKPLTQPASCEQQVAEMKEEENKEFEDQLDGLKERERRKVLRQKKKEEEEAAAAAKAARRAALGLDTYDDDDDLDDMEQYLSD
ncbi:unnamed protein product [Aphanomyces euteiches]